MLCSLFEGRADAGGALVAPFPRASASSASSPATAAPVVIYAHCNSGSRRDAEEVMGLLLPAGIAVAALDFSGSGLSDGGFVSLGAFEAEDLADLVSLLRRERGPECRIAIWGRSMGAVAALLAAAAEAREAASAAAKNGDASTAATSPSSTARIAAVVLDSPFSSLPELMAELVSKQKLLPLPRALLSSKGFLLKMMARSVEKRAGFDLRTVVPLAAVSRASLGSPSSYGGRPKEGKAATASADGGEERASLFAALLPPALFGHAESDSFISPRHSRALHGCYLGADKALCAFGGDHNSARPASFRSAALGFLKEVLFSAGAAGEMRMGATATAATEKTNSPSPLASLGAATAFDAALSAAAPDHHGSGAVAARHTTDERESWGRAAATAAAAFDPQAFASSASLFPPSGGNADAEDDDEELLEMERAIAASLELTCAEAEREAREAREAALAAAAAAAAAAEQLRQQRGQREREQKQTAEAAAVTHRSSFTAPPDSLLGTTRAAAATAAVASFDLTPDQRELHAFFSPPSPTKAATAAAAVAAEKSGRQQEQEQERRRKPLTLPKVPPAVSSSSSSAAAASKKHVQARAGGWKS